MADLVQRLAMESGRRPASVGIGVPGPIDFATRSVVHPPNLPGWDVVPVAAILEEKLGTPVAIENDANAVILGEALHGAGRGKRIVLGLTCGTGVGGGIIIGGAVHRGATGTAAEIGHLVVRPNGRRCACGARGCLEAYASASAVTARARDAARRHPESSLANLVRDKLTSRDVTDAARAGDETALALLEETGVRLGQGVANAANLIDPDIVILAGGQMAASRFLLPVVRKTVADLAFGGAKRVKIVKHRLGDKAGIIGAAAAAE